MQNLDGTMWRLIEAYAFDDDGHQLPLPLGEHPTGFILFGAEWIIAAVIDGRSDVPPDVPSRAFGAYNGGVSL